MSIVEKSNSNNEKYFRLKDYCKSLQGYNQNSIENGDEVFNIIKAIKDFDINDVITNYRWEYRYTTVLELILMTGKHLIINAILNKFINKIEKDIAINESLSHDLLTVLYSNLSYENCITDTLTPLIFKFESLEFINKVNKFEKKLIILTYLIDQKENYSCSDKFLELIKSKYQEVLHEIEKDILIKYNNSIVNIQNLLNNLFSDLDYKPSDEMKELNVLIKSLNNKGQK